MIKKSIIKPIKWSYFFDNTSTQAALIDFVEARYDLEQFKHNCWPPNCKSEIQKMIDSGVSIRHWESLAVKALRRRNYNIINCVSKRQQLYELI